MSRTAWPCRCSYVKDPETSKRVARPNSPEAWEVVEVPELRIVDAVLWERAKARQASISFDIGRDDQGNALNRAHRRKFLLGAPDLRVLRRRLHHHGQGPLWLRRSPE
ncbi:hypothetical protein [Azospirillum canadense]|uniref:hypothetical protein n=1 Tax=Azospirillum canadense TaxID=403962 RepID=UPI002227E998|nr:hypothetical protein [Azospirillum canadense]MCW2242497.1 hypothetical protein [Azospirillum canadense]